MTLTGFGRLPAPGMLLAGGVGCVTAWMAAQLAPLIAVEPCVAPDRPVAWLGVHLSLLHRDPHGCASGELAVGPDATQGTWVTVMVTAPTLALNLVTTAGVIGCWALVRSWLTVLSGVVGRLWRVPAPPPWIPVLPDLLPFPHPVTFPRRRGDHSPVLRRGPPAPLAA